MNSNYNIGKLVSFFDIAGSKDSFDRIVIPKIQRDYAQGRPGKEKLRQRFLKRLFEAIDTHSATKCELDFVYGLKRKEDSGCVFYPIDGQQRLTTLFLLHLYVAKLAGIEKCETDWLRKFSYETRNSSKQFCERLYEIDSDKFRGIRDYIEDQWWFTNRWKNDPTISSMNVMLQHIDDHYRDWTKENMAAIWERLKVNITFWMLTLDDLNTTDDLYIKMNSRGKPLTDFEHFKAEVEGFIASGGDYNRHKADEFSLKIDTIWTDMLWNYRDRKYDGDPNKYADNGLDKMFLNIFRRYMIIEGTKMGIAYADAEKMDVLDLAGAVFKRQPGLIERFSNIMDFFASHQPVSGFFEGILTNVCEELRRDNEGDILKSQYRVFIDHDAAPDHVDYLKASAQNKIFSMRNMLMLEAFFEYAACGGDYDVRERIRVVRNLAFNSQDETRREKMKSLLLRVDKIMSSNEIAPSDPNEFRLLQKEQEINKLKWIANHPDDEMIIKCAENHSILVGNLAIYMDNDMCRTEDMSKHVSLFCHGAHYDTIERVLLTFGDYAPTVNNRLLYGGRNPKNWRSDIFTNRNNQTSEILHQLFTTLPDFDEETLNNRIVGWLREQELSSCFTWRYYMVRYDGMRHGDEARYCPVSDCERYNYYMMNRTNFNGKHWNPYLYCLFDEFSQSHYSAQLGDYYENLKFGEEGIEIVFKEKSFNVIYANSGTQTFNIPQNDKGFDTVDRVHFAFKTILDCLDDVHSSSDSQGALPSEN